MEVIPKKNRHFMPLVLLVKPTGLPSQDPYTELFYLLIVGLLFNWF